MSGLSTTQRRELKNAINDKLAAIDRLVGDENRVQVKDGNIAISPEDFAKAREMYREVGEAKALLDMAGVGEKMAANYDLNPESDSIALASAGAGGGEAKSLGEWFVQSAEFKHAQSTGNVRMDSGFKFNAPDIVAGGLFQERKDIYNTMNPADYVRQLGSIQFDPMVPRAFRRTRVRDLFPVATTSSNVIDYFESLGPVGANQGAKSVPDRNTGNTAFAQKPHTNLGFRSNQAPVRTLAHWEAAHRNALEDVPQMQSLINNELMYGLRLEEDRQILLGSNTNDELQGVMTKEGVQTYTASDTAADELRSDSVRRAMTKIVLQNYDPTGIVVHPEDWEHIELQRGIVGGSAGDGQYMVSNIAVGRQAQLWRLPVVESPAMPQHQFLVGAFGTGVQLYDRQQANIRTTDSHADFFTANAMVVLAEQRLALAVKVPASMCVGSFIGYEEPATS